MNAAKPFSAACERNRGPILEVLRAELAGDERVLEIGSGTGQHAVHFAAAMPGLLWQCTDRAEALDGIRAWLQEARLPNTPPPRELDVRRGPWPAPVDVVYTANTLHIMDWTAVQALFAALPAVLRPGGRLIVYGPFKCHGAHTAESNAAFDASLRARDPSMGVRDREAVEALAAAAGLERVAVHAMPANNQCLVWRRTGAPVPGR